MKKIKKLLLCFVTIGLIAVSGFTNISADEITPKAMETTVSVNKSYPTSLYNNGCYSNTNIKLIGTYDVRVANGNRTYSNIRLNASASGHPSDWTVEITGISTSGNSTGLTVVIRYRFLTSYWDCPITGGWFYNAITVNV